MGDIRLHEGELNIMELLWSNKVFPASLMFAIAFDMNIGDLRTNYGEPYNNAYYEIRICNENTISTIRKVVFI